MTTEAEDLVADFCRGPSGIRFSALFAILDDAGLRPKARAGTLEYCRGSGDAAEQLFAFRKGVQPVLSFPEPYWKNHRAELAGLLDRFSYSEKPPLEGPGSPSQFSAGQVEVTGATVERLQEICREIASGV